MAQLNIDHQDLYKDIRKFLLGLFPEATTQIVQFGQNISTLPYGAIVMNILFEKDFDYSTTHYDKVKGEAYVQNSVQATLQLDFYGEESQARSRVVANLWRNFYATDRLTVCQPLRARDPRHLPYINDSNLYEDRYMLELTLQYNPEITHKQDFVDSFDIQINPVL